MSRLSAGSVVFIVAGLTQSALAVSSSFTADNENWRVVAYPSTTYTSAPTDFGLATWLSTGGNPGGYIRSFDPSGGDTYFTAPAKFLGNQSAAYGTALEYDLYDHS